jgi:molecular chaperone DnaK
MKKDAEMNAEADKIKKEAVDTRNQADALVASTNKQMSELGEKLSQEQISKIESAKSRVETALKDNEADLKPAMEELNKAWSEASQNMYGDGNAPGAAPGGEPTGEQPQGEPAQDSTEEDVEEADYTVVDDEDKK